MARAWGVATLPPLPGRDTSQILAAAAGGDIGALLVAGADLDDLPDPAAALAALAATAFVVSLELRVSAVTDRADVVLPVAAAAEKAGTFVNWEGRPGTFEPALDIPGVESDLDVLRRIADEMDIHLGLPDAAAARQELAAWAWWARDQRTARRPPRAPRLARSPTPARRTRGRARRSWSPGTSCWTPGGCRTASRSWPARPGPVVARMSAATAAQAGTSDGGKVTVATARGSLTLPVEVAVMPDRVVWLPTRSAGSEIRRELAAGHGSLVTLRSAE